MELSLPITVYWDLTPNPPLDEPLLRLCDEILECRPLMLQLYDPSPVFNDSVGSIMERFRETPVAVSLTASYVSLSSPYVASLFELGAKELLLACSSLEFFRDNPCMPGAGISFSVTRDNWRQLPEVVSLCHESGVRRLVLPMQRLYKGEKPFLLDTDEQGILEAALAATEGKGALHLTIHDPFLWRAFNPGIPFPQGGCQAANTMIALAPDGGVYPCPTFPERIGLIGVNTLKNIIESSGKKELRSRIRSNPSSCSFCSEVSSCRGGCRGRSYVTYGSLDEIDDACKPE